MSNEEKVNVSKNIPLNFKEIICGLMLSDANIRMNGKNALMSIQQTHQELTPLGRGLLYLLFLFCLCRLTQPKRVPAALLPPFGEAGQR
jgi:hypothetical protein